MSVEPTTPSPLPEGLPTEQVEDLPKLGTVTVRGAGLSELMADEIGFSRAAADRGAGEDETAARTRAAAARTVRVLARQVLGADGQPVMTPAQWEIYGGRHMDSCMRLYAAAERLSSPPLEDVEKN